MRRLLVGVVAIAVFAVAAVLGIWYATGDSGGPAGVSTVLLPGGVVQRAEPPAPPPVMGPPRYKPPEGSWESIPAAARPQALGRVGAAIGRDLMAVHDQISTCFDEDVQARNGRLVPTQTLDPTKMDDNGTPILVLQIETTSGGARIVDAPVETHGGASDATIACAQRILRGRTVEVAGAKPGERYRAMYGLTQ